MSCAVATCTGTHHANGYCRPHYTKARRWGDPLHREPTTTERFWARVDTSAGPNECWPWTGFREPLRGYGHVMAFSERTKAHRVSWQLTHGPIPSGLIVLHSCDNPPCCNPAHLRLGTHADNAADKMARGRWAGGIGSRHGSARLTEAGVLAILERLAAGVARRELAAEYAVSVGTIHLIARGRTWRHVGEQLRAMRATMPDLPEVRRAA